MIDRHYEFAAPRYDLTEEDERLIEELVRTSGWSRKVLTALRKGLGGRCQEYAERAMRDFARTPPPPECKGKR